MTLVPGLLPQLDRIRAIPAALGLRPFSVVVRVRSWSGSDLASGTATDSDTTITVGPGSAPKVRHLSPREVVASGGQYQTGDYRVGPLTPDGSGYGVPVSTFRPALTAGQELLVKLTGPDTPSGGLWCRLVSVEADHALHRYAVVRPTGEAP